MSSVWILLFGILVGFLFGFAVGDAHGWLDGQKEALEILSREEMKRAPFIRARRW